MKVITFANNKGGVGKSAMSISIAAELAKQYKTILIDTDPQGNSGSNLVDNIQYELADVLNGKVQVEQAILKTNLENLFVITSIPTNSTLSKYRMSEAPSEPYIFCDVIDVLKQLGFEYVVFDTAPSFDIFEENIFLATDLVIPVLLLDQYSINGLNTFRVKLTDFQKRKRTDKPLVKDIILNQYDNRLSMSKNVKEALAALNYNFHIVPIDQNFKKSSSVKLPIQYIKDTKKETLTVLTEIMESIENALK